MRDRCLRHQPGSPDRYPRPVRRPLPAVFPDSGPGGTHTTTLLNDLTHGQATWRAFAVSLGVVSAPVVHAWPLAAVAAGVLVMANVLAAIPALGAARARPGRVLRAE